MKHSTNINQIIITAFAPLAMALCSMISTAPTSAASYSYSITYNDGIISNMPTNTSASSYDENVPISSQTPTREGYEFLGWCNTLPTTTDGTDSCSGTTYSPGGNFVINQTTTANSLSLYTMWEKTIMTIATATYLQDVEECPSTLTTGQVYSLKDSRDEQSYNVAKLADGKCWLLDNLALDLTSSTVLSAMNSTNTNASDTTLGYLKNGGGTTSDQYATAKVANWTSSYSYSAPLVNMGYRETVPTDATSTAGGYKIGGYYNYCAASAGSYCYGNGTSSGTSSGNATESICPAGWRMPGGSSTIALTATPPTGEYQNLYTNHYTTYAAYRAALRLPLSGWFNNGSPSYQGSYGEGKFWSSTRALDSFMYYLGLDTSSIDPAKSLNRGYGLSVRCVLDSSVTHPTSATTMQSVTSSDLATLMPNDGDTTSLSDARDDQEYTIANINGAYWMTRNLAIGCNGSGDTYGDTVSSVSLTSSDSNVSDGWSTPTALLSAASSSTQTADYTDPRMQCSDTYGAWYNYAAASAGTITGSSNSSTTTYDICPAGWRLPTNDEFAGITSYTTAFAPVTGGYYSSGSISSQSTSKGYWWSASRNSSTKNYYLSGSSSSLSTGNGARYRGDYVRCIKTI